MVPRQPEMPSDNKVEQVSSSEDGESNADPTSSEARNEQFDVEGDMEQEYHTEESENDSENEEPDSDMDILATSAPLLPPELLKPLPIPAYSLHQPISIPRDQMTREQKVAQRNRSRKVKKRAWDRLGRDSEGIGVLEAGKVAQWKRGLVVRGDKVRNRRITKQVKVKQQGSGRQQLLEDRKRAIEESKSRLMRPAKKQRRMGRKMASAS
jgi:hypothetical protein